MNTKVAHSVFDSLLASYFFSHLGTAFTRCFVYRDGFGYLRLFYSQVCPSPYIWRRLDDGVALRHAYHLAGMRVVCVFFLDLWYMALMCVCIYQDLVGLVR